MRQHGDWKKANQQREQTRDSLTTEKGGAENEKEKHIQCVCPRVRHTCSMTGFPNNIHTFKRRRVNGAYPFTLFPWKV